MKSQLRPALLLFAALATLTGLVYPLVVTGVAQAVFPEKANGSVITVGNRDLGSRLIGQPFSDPKYFWGRPSATTPAPYEASGSSGSNLGPTNPALVDAVQARIAALRAADPGTTGPVPVDLVTSSGSGLDPHISLAAALYQAPRVARARGIAPDAVRRLVRAFTDSRALGVFGEPRVDVLAINIALDGMK